MDLFYGWGVKYMSVTTVDFWVKSFDNTYLKCAKDVVNSPKATILILHELAEH